MVKVAGKKLGGLAVGQTAEVRRVFTASDVEQFAALTGDKNPIHLDADFAASTPFGARIAHGMLVSSLFSTIFATAVPSTVYVNQNLSFKKPVYLDEEVVAKIEVVKIDRRFVTCQTTIAKLSADEELLAVDGSAVVMVPPE